MKKWLKDTHVHPLATELGTPCWFQDFPCFQIHNCHKALRREIWLHSDVIVSSCCCRFVSCTSMKRISTSQVCFIGLGPKDCGGHWSTMMSLSCSRNKFRDDLSYVTWCIILLEVAVTTWVKGMDMVSNNTQVGCGV
ncbi:hypothetical protein AMECASPLE_005090 [Ameca splendens]|uniref:Uncharacterized protein n=1 Tax=Ameca splendens TaxID=208324 RepID=A0ABV1A5A0_9TELE